MRWVKYDKIEKIRKHLIIVFVNLFLQKFIFIALFLRFSVSILAFTHWQAYTLTHTHTIYLHQYIYINRLRISVHIVLAMYIMKFTNIFFFTNELLNIALTYTQKDRSIYSPKINQEFLRQHTPMKWLNGYHKVSQINVSRRISLGGLKSLETRVLRSTVGGGWGQGGVAR